MKSAVAELPPGQGYRALFDLGQERIFGMFQQLDKSYEGSGIGLALVRKTAERMDGRAGGESQPGKGSRFRVELKKANPLIQ